MTALFIVLARSAIAASLALAQPQQDQPQPSQPEPAPTTTEIQAPPLEIKVKQPGAKQPGAIRTADDLLTALETADAGLKTLTAGIRYDRTFEIAGDRQVREGTLYFEARPREADRADRRFSIRFDRLIVGQRVRDEVKEFIFDGEWLVEKLPGEKPKMFTKRQVVPPGERFDPLRIGEGPMPIPIGQRREDILSRYAAELVPADSDLSELELKTFVKESYQLKLTPRADRPDEDEFREIRLWYRQSPAVGGQPAMLLPRMARTINRSGDESVVQLINVQVNGPIPADVMKTDTPGPKDGWDVQVIPFRQGLKEEPAGSAGGGPGKP